jgi:hypothetical protein
MPVSPWRRLPGRASFWGPKRLKRKFGVLRTDTMAPMRYASSRTTDLAIKLVPQMLS